jgi:hypothetical protein
LQQQQQQQQLTWACSVSKGTCASSCVLLTWASSVFEAVQSDTTATLQDAQLSS